MTSLCLHVIYRDPSDYPGRYVVRRQYAGADGVSAEAVPLVVTDNLTSARAALPLGLHNIGRAPDDDRAILEVWI